MKKTTMALLLGCATIFVATVALSPAHAAETGAPVTNQTPSAVSDSSSSRPAGNPLTTPEVATPAIMVAEPDYPIQEEDVLRLDVWGEPQLTNMQMQVTPDGKINVPYIGEMLVKGLTQAKVTENVAAALENANILINPKVVVTLLSMHRPTVRVLGAVQKSGEFQFKEGDRVLDAVAQAGYLDNSWLEEAKLTRRGSDGELVVTKINLQTILDGNNAENIALKKGDVINIPAEEYQNKFYVMGQVMRPMMYDLKDNTRVLSAINLAGGQTERGELRSTIIIRNPNPDDPNSKPEKVKCDLSKLFDKADLSQNIVLKAGDVVYVPETKKPNWGKISQILSTISSLTYIRRYGLF